MLSDLLPCVCLSVTFLIVKRVGTPVFLEFISLKDSMLLRMISSGRSSVRRFCVCWGAGLILDQLSPQVNRLWNPPGFPGLSFQIPIEWVFLQIASPFKIPRWISTAYKSSLKTWFWLSAWKIFPDTPYVLGFPTVFILIFHQTGLKYLYSCTSCLELHSCSSHSSLKLHPIPQNAVHVPFFARNLA